MNLDEVIGEVGQRHGCDVVLNLFREGVSQASEPTSGHSHAEVMAFDIAGVDVFRVGGAGNGVALASKTHSGAVPLLSAFGYAVDLDEHGVVDIATKRLIDRLDVHLQSIASKLDAIRQTARKVFKEVTGGFRVALADQPARHQLGIGINRGPEPSIARAGIVGRDLGRHILLLRVAERPALIDLHPFALEVLENQVLVLSAERADLVDQTHHGLFGHACYADGGADAVSFNQATDDLGALFGSEPVHMSSMPYGSRIVNTFEIK